MALVADLAQCEEVVAAFKSDSVSLFSSCTAYYSGCTTGPNTIYM